MTFEHKGNLHGLRNEIRKLCRYYPVPVVMDDAAVLQEHFLKDAVYKETTEGVQIGVFRSTMGYGVHLTVVNFHGHVIGNQQPVVIEPLRGYGRAAPEYWFTRIHVDHAPQLELVLPARNEVVSNNYWTELLVQCERAIYNAMARTEPQPKLRHWDWRRAQSLGVTLREPPARLNPWQPRKQEDRLRSHQQRSSPTTAVTETENTRPIVMRAHVSPPEEHALARALRLSDTPVQLMADDPNLSGYQWYNDLEYVIEVQVYEETAGTRSVLPAHDEDEDQPEHGTADRIVCVLRVRTGTGRIENIEVTGDVGFRNSSAAGWPETDIAVVLANDTTITSQELTTMMVEAFFDPSYDGDTESRETQHEMFKQECRIIATTLRVSEDEARKEYLTTLGLVFGRELRTTENVRISRVSGRFAGPKQARGRRLRGHHRGAARAVGPGRPGGLGPGSSSGRGAGAGPALRRCCRARGGGGTACRRRRRGSAAGWRPVRRFGARVRARAGRPRRAPRSGARCPGGRRAAPSGE